LLLEHRIHQLWQ